MLNQKKKDNYNAKDIQVLENIEAVRKRPGMYIGSTDEQGWHHLFQEVIDNSIDEAVAGYCSEIQISLSADQKTITIEDNGRGIPIEVHPETKKSTLETIFTVLHSGGKFSDQVYKTSGGLHGVGVTAVNALSKRLEVWSRRGEKVEYIEFNEGLLVNSRIEENSDGKKGIKVTFLPDEKIFQEFTHFKIENIKNRLKELAYLNPNIKISFSFSPEEDPEFFYYSSGLTGWVREINAEDALENSDICSEEVTKSSKKDYFYLNFAFQYNNKNSKYRMKSFCNNISTEGGGTHIEGFENGLVSATRDWIRDKYPQIKFNILKEDVVDSLVAIVSIRMKDPQFSGQTKDRLANKNIREIVKSNTYDLVKKFLQDHVSSAESISKHIMNVAQNRTKTEEYQKSLREGGRSVLIPDKLAPCVSKESEGNELFIVEGESAGGSAKLARDPFNQAVLPVQGKIINAEKADRAKIIENEEIKNLINALGFSVNEAIQNYYNRFISQINEGKVEEGTEIAESFSYSKGEEEFIIPAHTEINFEQLKTIVEKTRNDLIKKLRYGKIVIMTDADPDGRHIECLALTFFAKYFRYLIEDHRIYLAIPPLYRLKGRSGEVRYFYSESELLVYREQNSEERGSKLQRFKGLGEMNPKQLRETTMNSKKRCLHELLFENPSDIKTIIEELMGSKSDQRRERLESGEHKNLKLLAKDNKVDISQALLVKFLEYAYSVVEDRALPQLYDGLKPVQRRILFTLGQLNLHPGRSYSKSAKIVGEVMGKYHPHGDSSIYQAMVKMAQDFNYRYPLVDGQGNWGSIDGDPAAAMRYTEARLTKFGSYLLEDLAYDTVDWEKNYDETEEEPKILPANLNLLLNGSNGIAVGMSTNIPPHNLLELSSAVIELIRNPEMSLDEIMKFLPAPDFPTGGIILEKEKIKDIYEKGEGTIYVRAKTEIISSKNDGKKDLILVKELPYKVNKGNLVSSISQIIREKKIEGLKSISDYSSYEETVNIHIKFDHNYDGNIILNQLCKKTLLQSTFSVKMRALVDNKPKIFPIKNILEEFIVQRSNNIRKKSIFIHSRNDKELSNLETKKFIVENYSEIIEIIKNSTGSEERMKEGFKDRFDLDEESIIKVLDTPSSFRQFTPERREKLKREIESLKLNNELQRKLIDNESERRLALVEELEDLKKNYYKDFRKTFLTSISHSITERELIPHENRVVVFGIYENKKEKKVLNFFTNYQVDNFDGTNIPSVGKELKSRGDSWGIARVDRRENIWLFSNLGRVYPLSFYLFSATNKTTNLDEEYFIRKRKGVHESILKTQEFFTSFIVVPEANNKKFLLLLTEKGAVKKIKVESLAKLGKNGKKIISLKKKTKCSIHLEKAEAHKSYDCCDKSLGLKSYVNCEFFKKLQKEIKNCSDCQQDFNFENKIVKAIFVNGDEDINVIIKKKRLIGGDPTNIRIDNFKTSIFTKSRKKNEKGEKMFCKLHAVIVRGHKEDPNHECGIDCSFVRTLQKEIKNCSDCQSPNLSEKHIKKQIRCSKALDMIVSSSEDSNRNYILILAKEDNSCEKRQFSKIKNFICSDNRQKKTPYCKRHWEQLEKSKKNLDEINLKVQASKESLEKGITSSSLISKEEKEKLLSDFKIKINEDLRRKIENSDFEMIRNDEAVKSELVFLNSKYLEYKKSLEEKRKKIEISREIQDSKEQCENCKNYCRKHEENLTSLTSHHNDCKHCGGKLREIEILKTGLTSVEKEISDLEKKENNGKNKKLKKKKKIQLSLKENLVKVRREYFIVQASCPQLNELKNDRKKCKDCIAKSEKKHVTKLSNPLISLNLVALTPTEEKSPQMYILSEDSVCWYNKKDFLSFLENKENKTRSILKDKNKKITDIKIYL